MFRRFFTIIPVLLLLFCCDYSVGREVKVRKDFRKAAKRYRFKIQQYKRIPDSITGTALPVKAAEKELTMFFDALDDLGADFVKKSGLKQVVICRDLKLKGMVCAGVAHGDCMYLAQGATKKTVYHELFHIFDPKRQNKEWTSLNNRKFRYWGVIYPDDPEAEEQRRKVAAYYKKTGYKFQNDFVSNYAQSNEVEDRAETFAVMVAEGSAFIKRAKKSTVLYSKMLFIINLTNRSSLLGRKFWREKLGSWIDNPVPGVKNR